MNSPKFFFAIMALVATTFVFHLAPAFGQVDTAWVRRYNGPLNCNDWVNAIAVDDSGNVYVTGGVDEIWKYGRYPDYATIKYKPNGDTAWLRRYNGEIQGGWDEADAIVIDDLGNIYVTGYSAGYMGGTVYDYATIKYDPNGNELWVARYNGPGNDRDYAQAIAIDDSGYVYVTGYSWGGTSYDYATIKYKPNGDTAWLRRYSDGYANAIAVDDSNYVYVTGGNWSGSNSDYCTLKYLRNGNVAPGWPRTYSGSANSYDIANAITVDNSGYVYVTGECKNVGTAEDYVTIKYLPNGDIGWQRSYDGPGIAPEPEMDDVARAIAVDASGNVYVTGESYGNGTGFDYATIKYLPNGDVTPGWPRRYNGPGNYDDYATAISLDGFGNVYVTGESYGNGTGADYATIKYYPNGDIAWVRTYNGPLNGGDRANAIAVDGSGNVYVTGASSDTSSGWYSDYLTIKYIPTYGLISPNGGEAWQAGHQYPITWSFQGFTGNVRIDCSINSGASFDYTIVSSYPNTGEYLWTVPIWTYSNHCRVRVCDSADCVPADSSDSNFTIYICGDVTKDGVVDASDLISVLNYLFAHGPVPPWPAGDVNSDGTVDASDLIYLLNYLFAHGPAPICLLRL